MNPTAIINELKNARKSPLLFALSLILIVMLISSVSWLTGFWGKRGEQFAENVSKSHPQYDKIAVENISFPPVANASKSQREDIQNANIFAFNKDFMSRDKIVGISVDWQNEKSGTVRFDSLDFSALSELFEKKFINPLGRQNESPTAEKIYDFMEVHKEIKAHGYVVSPFRSDYRVTIEGVILEEEYITKDLKIAFFEFCKNADELDTSSDLYCWWD